LINIDTHREVFAWVLGLLAERGLLKGQRMGIDATTLEANAAMRSIPRRDTGETYEEFLRGLAKASGIETPTREDLARVDRKRKKRASNQAWKSPADRDVLELPNLYLSAEVSHSSHVSVVSSDKTNVHLNSGTEMILRLNAR
jgi:hypothetical protein